MEEHYKNLAEMYHFEYDMQIKPAIDILSVQGILLEMESETLQFKIKKGESERANHRLKMIKIIADFLDSVGGVNNRNIQLRHLLKESIRERDILEAENERLKKELEGVEKAWKAA